MGSQNAVAAPKLKRICASKSGVNTITWYKYNHSCEQFRSIHIYARENTFASYKLIDSVTDESILSYTHLLATTFQQGSYFLKFNLKCGGVWIPIYSDTITVDVVAPPVMDPDSISVGADGEIFIGWTPSSADDAKSYVIYRTDNSGNKIIDVVTGRFNTTYTDTKNGDAAARAEKYKIAPTDSCDNIAPIGNFHQTMLLSLSQDKCASEVYLKWTPYIGWKEGIERYDIFYSDDKYLNYKKLGESTTESFTARFLLNHTNLYFYVRAYKRSNAITTATSTSNRLSLTTDFEDSTQVLYLSDVTYQKNSNILEVDWHVPVGHNYIYFDVQRGKAPGKLEKVGRVNATSTTDFSFTETDPDSNFTWYYRINGFSKCGRSLGKSNISNNIRLNLTQTLLDRKLSWNNYNSWPAGVETYEIYRTTVKSGIVSEDKIASLNKDAISYNDLDIVESDARPGICYYVKAIEKDGNPYGLKKESYSNFTCYTVPPIVNIPNAFNPHDIYNKAFFPVVLYADTIQSTYSIYNRWGESIFTNQPIWKSWDGKLANGKDAPEGVYFYKAIVVGIDNSTKVYSAGFTLL